MSVSLRIRECQVKSKVIFEENYIDLMIVCIMFKQVLLFSFKSHKILANLGFITALMRF